MSRTDEKMAAVRLGTMAEVLHLEITELLATRPETLHRLVAMPEHILGLLNAIGANCDMMIDEEEAP